MLARWGQLRIGVIWVSASGEYGMRNSSRRYVPCWARVKAVVAVAAGAAILSGCGLSSITNGIGSGWFSSKKNEVSTTASVSEDSLLSAAKLDTSGASSSLSVAHGCPKFVVWAQDRHMTTYEAGRAGDGLGIIHRGEITKTARECQIQDGRVTVKYGFSGRVLLGPKGAPGIVTLPVQVKVVGGSQEQLQAEKMNVAVPISPEKPIGYFSTVKTVSFPIPVGSRPADYRVYVGFDQAKKAG